MGTFKVGDRVRINQDDWRDQFKAGYITTIGGLDDTGVYFNGPAGSRRWVPFEQIELAPKFSVGDRVRFTDKCPRAWRFGPHTEHKEGTVRSLNLDGGVDTVNVGGGRGYITDQAQVEPASLRIQAGEYYRTRDGRKVGPMRARGLLNSNYQWESEGYIWKDNGENYDKGSEHTIVAEWPEEQSEEPKRYSSCEAAQVDVQREEYGAPAIFKDGVITFGTFVVDGHTKRPAIVARLDNGQPKPSELPRVHADRAPATAEAERLAAKQPGKEFGVYVLVATRKEEPKHEWQRLAFAGDKDGAVAALRKASGISEWTAWQAVSDLAA